MVCMDYICIFWESLRNVSRAIDTTICSEKPCCCLGIGTKIQILNRSIHVNEYICISVVDEIMIQIGNTKAWLWISLESV